MNLVTPDFGLVFWMVLSFAIVLYILKRFAWKPILESLKERENSIEDSLKMAENARNEMAKLKADNEKIMQEARNERNLMMKDAQEMKNKIISDAKRQADLEANKLFTNAKLQIENEKNAAINEIRETIITLSIDIAEKILNKSLDSDIKQKEHINSLLKEVKFN